MRNRENAEERTNSEDKKKYIYSLHNTDMALQAKAFSYTFVTPYPRVSRAV